MPEGLNVGVWGVEIALGCLGLVQLVWDLFLPKTSARRRIAFLGLCGYLVILWWISDMEPVGTGWVGAAAFGGNDAFGLFFKKFFLVVAAGVTACALAFTKDLPDGRGEFPTLITFATLGMTALASASDLLTLFLSLELLTITLFMLSAWRRRDALSVEAGLKLLIAGATAASFMLYGIAWAYGSSGGLSFDAVAAAARGGDALPAGLAVASALMMVGILFKVGGAPFQAWVPDVYQGAPTPVTAFLSVGSKAAGILILLRMFHSVLLPAADILAAPLAWVVGLTLFIGNLGAIRQRDLKRLLGYSSVGHAGYLLLAFATFSERGAAAAMMYLVAYLPTVLGIFFCLCVATSMTRSSSVGSLTGLNRRSPLLAFGFCVALMSLAGVPPFAGFFGKLTVLMAAVQADLFWLVVLGLINVVIGLYVYLRVVKAMYLDPLPEGAGPLAVPALQRWVILVGVAATVGIGIWQRPFYEAAERAAAALFSS